MFVASTESAFLVGIYAQITSVTPFCDCSDPPCAVRAGSAYSNMGVSILVLLVDFYFTRGFATDLRVQLQRAKRTVEVAAEITAALARYDVDEAEKAIEGGEGISVELAESFGQLLSNLRSYKAYLPHS
eukprot:Hpha_TRINITY_DN17653_c0_g1::TRINITY_DN17653_c0_g1_i1::g.158722::m.158722